MRRIGVLVAVGVAVGLGSGCVPKSRYDGLVTEHQKDRSELEETREILAREQAEQKAIAERLAALEAQLGATLRDKSSLQGDIDQMQVALADLKRRKAEADARIEEFRALVSRFQSMIDAGKLRVRIRDGRMVVELATDVLFPSGSAQLSREGRAAITEMAGLLATIPDRHFQIEGHTDDVPTRAGTWPSNWELASARSLTVLRTMLDSGMAPARISAASFGDSRPARPNDSDENRAANRRIEVVVIPDLSSLPGFDELQRVSAPAK